MKFPQLEVVIRNLILPVALVMAACTPPETQETVDAVFIEAEPTEAHFGRIQQLTFSGNNAESYFSQSGEQLIFSNNDLLKSRIRNYKRMYERRVVYHFGVVYETTREKLQIIPDIVEKFFEAREKIRYDRTHFKKFGDFALNFETVFHMLDPNYRLYMDTMQDLNLYLMEQFEEEKIEFAYPTQKLFIENSSTD